MLRIILSQLTLGTWLFYHARRLLPEDAGLHTRSCVSGASAAVAVWLSATDGVSWWFSSIWAIIPVLSSGLVSTAAAAIMDYRFPETLTATTHRDLGLSLTPFSAGLIAANIVGGALQPPRLGRSRLGRTTCSSPFGECRPKRSGFITAQVVGTALAFWMAVLAGALKTWQAQVSVDGALRSINALRFVASTSCAFRPDRLYKLASTWREPQCIKKALVRMLGPFERLCVLPQSFNKCFDWDIFDTRWVPPIRKPRQSIPSPSAPHPSRQLSIHPCPHHPSYTPHHTTPKHCMVWHSMDGVA